MRIFSRSLTADAVKRRSENVFNMGKSYSRVAVISVIIFFIFNICCKKKNTPSEVTDTKLWETSLPAVIYFSSPALSIDNKTVYIGTSTWLTGNHTGGQVFVALDASTGKENWRLDIGNNEVRSTPAIASDKSIFFSVEVRDPVYKTIIGDELWHVSAEGNIIWTFDLSSVGFTDILRSSPAIDDNGVLYISDLNGIVYAFQTKSRGTDKSAYWPKFRGDNQNIG